MTQITYEYTFQNNTKNYQLLEYQFLKRSKPLQMWQSTNSGASISAADLQLFLL